MDLRWNDINNNGAQAILTSLESNSSIINLELAGNAVAEEILAEIDALC
jgi:hypothetical protein